MIITIEKETRKEKNIKGGNFIIGVFQGGLQQNVFVIEHTFCKTYSLINIENGETYIKDMDKETIFEELYKDFDKIGYVKKEDAEFKIKNVEWGI